MLENPHSREIAPPTEAQMSSARVNAYFGKLNIFSAIAENYALQKEKNALSLHEKPEQKEFYQRHALGVLHELYFHANDNDRVKRLTHDYDDGERLASLAVGAKDTLDAVERRALESANQLGPAQRSTILLKAALFGAGRAPLEQKLKLQELAGNSIHDLTKLTESAKWSLLIVAPLEAAIFTSNLIAIHPFLADIKDPHTQLAVALSFAINAAATLVNTRQNFRTLQTPGLEISTNFLVTYIYMLAKKQFPESKFWPNLLVAAFSTLPIFGVELIQFPEVFLPNLPSAVVTRNFIGAFSQIIKSTVGEYLIRNAKQSPNY